MKTSDIGLVMKLSNRIIYHKRHNLDYGTSQKKYSGQWVPPTTV